MRSVVASVASLLLATGYATVASAGEPHPHAKQKHHVITIDSLSVHPPVLNAAAGDVVVFVNYVGWNVQVRFDASAKDGFDCPARPKFYLTAAGGLVSDPFGNGEFSMPCRLKPGTYEYSVMGTQEGEGEWVEVDTPTDADPKGKIVVTAP